MSATTELARRKAAWKKPAPKYPRGYGALYSDHIGQADQGCDFDFLGAARRYPRAGNSLTRRRAARFQLEKL